MNINSGTRHLKVYSHWFEITLSACVINKRHKTCYNNYYALQHTKVADQLYVCAENESGLSLMKDKHCMQRYTIA